MIKLERITTKVTVAILLQDELSIDKKVIGDVSIKALGIRKKPIFHSTGYYFLLDTLKKFKVIAGGGLYKEKSFKINIASPQGTLPAGSKPASPKIPVVKIKLTRK